MLGKKELFGNHIEPACGYCRFGKPTSDGGRILCPKMGVTAPHFHCRHYRYNPLRRMPSRQAQLPKYNPSDFEI